MSNILEVTHYHYCIHEYHVPQAGLHWDLRLEWNGVAKSWALQKDHEWILTYPMFNL